MALVLVISGGDPDQTASSVVGVVLLIVLFAAIIVFRAGIFRRQIEEDLRANRNTPLMRGLMDRTRRFWVILCIAVGISVLVFAMALGSEQARNQLIFPVTDTSSPEVDLAIYGDTVVLAPFDQARHTVLPAFDIVKIGPTSCIFDWRELVRSGPTRR